MIRFDHINIRVTDQEAVRDFLAAVVGVRQGPRPNFSFHGYWLYLGDLPVIHLAPRDAPGEVGWANHIAFAGYDLERKTAELKDAGLNFRVQRLADTDIPQIFVKGPEGLLVELQCVVPG
jgi:catechol 2,3-dioxygenase-like lactoylglutathione lyase family enzyme